VGVAAWPQSITATMTYCMVHAGASRHAPNSCSHPTAPHRVLHKLGRVKTNGQLSDAEKDEVDAMSLVELLADLALPPTRRQCSSDFIGLSWGDGGGAPWRVRCFSRGVQLHVGTYEDEEDGARAHDEVLVELEPELVCATATIRKARLNFPDEETLPCSEQLLSRINNRGNGKRDARGDAVRGRDAALQRAAAAATEVKPSGSGGGGEAGPSGAAGPSGGGDGGGGRQVPSGASEAAAAYARESAQRQAVAAQAGPEEGRPEEGRARRGSVTGRGDSFVGVGVRLSV
jgi:hypothetical protein